MTPDQNSTVQIYSSGMAEIIPAKETTDTKRQTRCSMQPKSTANKNKIDTYSWNSQWKFKKTLHRSGLYMDSLVTLNPPDEFYTDCNDAEAIINKCRELSSKITGWIKRKGITGFSRIEYAIRNTGSYKGLTLPHIHMVLDASFRAHEDDFIKFWLGNRNLGGLGCCDMEAVRLHSHNNRPLQDISGGWINYLIKPNDNRAMKKLAGPDPQKDKHGRYKAAFPIGRSWFKIGKPQEEKPEEVSLNPIEARQLRRHLNRTVAGQVKSHSKGRKTISKARKLTLGDPKRKATVFLKKETINRLIDLAKKLAQAKQPPTRCAMNGVVFPCNGWAAEGEKYCPDCLRTFGKLMGKNSGQACQDIYDFNMQNAA